LLPRASVPRAGGGERIGDLYQYLESIPLIYIVFFSMLDFPQQTQIRAQVGGGLDEGGGFGDPAAMAEPGHLPGSIIRGHGGLMAEADALSPPEAGGGPSPLEAAFACPGTS